MPVCSEVCDKLHIIPFFALAGRISYTDIVEGKYCPDCGCDNGLFMEDSVTYFIICYRCASIFTATDADAGVRLEERSNNIVSRSYFKGRGIKKVLGLVEVITFVEFIKGIKY